MNITLKIIRIIIKFIFILTVIAVNTVFIYFFIVVVWAILSMFGLDSIFIYGPYSKLWLYSITYGPLIFITLYILYRISPIGIYFLKRKEHHLRLTSQEEYIIKKLLAEIPIYRKLKVYKVYNHELNACAYGFRSVCFTQVLLQQASDEMLKGIICHEIAHLKHYDFIYQTIIISMRNLGISCINLSYIILGNILIFFFRIMEGIINILIPTRGAISNAIVFLMNKIMQFLIYIFSKLIELIDVNINKYGEYRCDKFAHRNNCAEGLLHFLKALHEQEKRYSSPMSFIEYSFSTHPATHKRIARLEKLIAS